jgi:MAGUK p55 subfamily member 2/6
MCILDCAPSALKLLHNSAEFMPFVIFVGAPGMEQLKTLYAERRAAGGSQRNLAVRYFPTNLFMLFDV